MVEQTVLYVGQEKHEEQGTDLSQEFWDKFHEALNNEEDLIVYCVDENYDSIGDITFELCEADGAYDIVITNERDEDWNKTGTENHYAWPSHAGFKDEVDGYVRTLVSYCENGFQ